jgi:hypothetical protein
VGSVAQEASTTSSQPPRAGPDRRGSGSRRLGDALPLDRARVSSRSQGRRRHAKRSGKVRPRLLDVDPDPSVSSRPRLPAAISARIAGELPPPRARRSAISARRDRPRTSGRLADAHGRGDRVAAEAVRRLVGRSRTTRYSPTRSGDSHVRPSRPRRPIWRSATTTVPRAPSPRARRASSLVEPVDSSTTMRRTRSTSPAPRPGSASIAAGSALRGGLEVHREIGGADGVRQVAEAEAIDAGLATGAKRSRAQTARGFEHDLALPRATHPASSGSVMLSRRARPAPAAIASSSSRS